MNFAFCLIEGGNRSALVNVFWSKKESLKKSLLKEMRSLSGKVKFEK